MEKQDELISYLMDMLVSKLRPVLYEIIKEAVQLPPPQEKESEEFLTITQVTQMFKCSRGKIYSHQRNGQIRSFKFGNRSYYLASDLMKSLKKRGIN